jgi:hypothetical protein
LYVVKRSKSVEESLHVVVPYSYFSGIEIVFRWGLEYEILSPKKILAAVLTE